MATLPRHSGLPAAKCCLKAIKPTPWDHHKGQGLGADATDIGILNLRVLGGATCQGTRCDGAGPHSRELTSLLLKWICSVTCTGDLFMCQEHPVTFVLIPMTSSVSPCRILWGDLSKSRENKRFFGTSEDGWLSVPECRVMVWKRPRTPYLALKGFQYTETHFFFKCAPISHVRPSSFVYSVQLHLNQLVPKRVNAK